MKSIVYIALAILIGVSSMVPVLADSMFSCADVIELPQIECEALVALYNSTNGPGWTDHSNWLVTNTPGDWYGVGVFSGHVKSLHLSSNQMSGNLPPELGNLSNLSYLWLYSNQLSGSIPPELGNLSSLGDLSLFDNQLSGNIPHILGTLSNLKYLSLSYNQLSGGIPPELGNLTNLSEVWLDNNQLSGSIPPELGNLTSLKYLHLSGNQLSGTIPVELGNLTNLLWLLMERNQLTGNIPPVLGNLTGLQLLFLSSNQLSGSIPAELGNLTGLVILSLEDNLLEGDVPTSFVNLVNLHDPGYSIDGLDLDYNILNVPPGYPDPNDPLQVFLSQKDPDWQLYQGFTQVIGAGGGELTSLDGRTDFVFPPGAVISDTTFTFIPKPAPSHNHFGLGFAHNSFLLTAEDAYGNPVTTFYLPVTVTPTYTDTDFGGMSEDTLGLYYWDETGGSWLDAVTTCPGGMYTRDPAANSLSLPLCHLTEFGVFDIPLRFFMPVIQR